MAPGCEALRTPPTVMVRLSVPLAIVMFVAHRIETACPLTLTTAELPLAASFPVTTHVAVVTLDTSQFGGNVTTVAVVLLVTTSVLPVNPVVRTIGPIAQLVTA